MRQAVGVVAAIAVALAVSAWALGASVLGSSALPEKDALLGGGKIGPRFETRAALGHPDVAYTTIRIDKTSALSFHIYGEWPIPCKGRAAVTAIFDTDVELEPDGTFEATGLVPPSSIIPKGLKYNFSGAFTSATTAQLGGGASFAFVENGKRYQCAGSGVKTEVRVAPTVSGGPAPAPGATYYGTTSDTGAVLLRVTADGKGVAQIAEEGWLDCHTKELKKNGGPFIRNTSPPATIGAGGTFAGEERYDAVNSFLPGTVTRIHSEIAGKFGASSVGGTWTVEAKVVDKKTGATSDTCKRKVTWTMST